MQSRTLRLAMASIGLSGIFAVSQAGMAPLPTAQIAKTIKSLKASQKPNKVEVAQKLQGKVQEINELKTKASEVTKKIGSLASDGKLATSSENTALLQELVDQLKQTNESLKKVQEDVEGILGWIEGQNENLPVMATDIAQLKRVTVSNYVQFQWQHTDGDTGQPARQNGFQMRRFRMGMTNKISDETSMKLSFDVATGASRTSAELKDAILFYDVVPSVEDVGTQFALGQQPLPLGYEIERSSSEREFPERAIYNTTLFNGERDRGVNLKYGFHKGMFAHVGVWNGMTFNDPQQAARGFGDVDSKVGFSAGVRSYGRNYDYGITTFQAERPGFVPTVNPVQVVPTTRRSLIYVDGTYVGFLTEALTIRGEFMFGKDRPPTGGTNNPTYRRQTDVLGWQGQLTYALDPSNQLHFRYQAFDPDVTSSSNDYQDSYGYGYTHWFNPGVKITLSYEVFRETPAQKNNVWTIRSQFKL